jgi:hypothetical protein
MKMNGEMDSLYVKARRVLLDALDALEPHINAVILVGAQAIYLHTGESDFAVSPYTTDADIALDPRNLADEPKLDQLMGQAGFVLSDQPGIWRGKDSIPVDLLVPEILGGKGRRGARLKGHSNRAARKVKSLEVTLVDKEVQTITALEEADSRQCRVSVAGPGALLVTKLHKLHERKDQTTRLKNKDALDVFRLLTAVSTKKLNERLHLLNKNPLSQEATKQAMDYLKELFGSPEAAGSKMTVQALEPLEDPETVALSCSTLANDLFIRPL